MTIVSSKRDRRILLVGFGQIDKSVFQILGSELPKTFPYKVIFTATLPIPAEAYYRRRHQYFSPIFIKKLKSVPHKPGDLILGIVDVDLFVPGLNFVFGQADPQSCAAIISLTRLRPSFYGGKENSQLFARRVLTEAVHELGHTLGLPHCSNRRCVMYFSNSLMDTDIKGYKFCPQCQAKLKNRLK